MDLRHGFRAFFFQRPPDRFVRERIDEFEFDDFLGQQSQRPAIAALWRCRAGQLREVRFNPAIDFRRDRRRAPQLSDQGRLGSIQNRSLAPVLNGPFGDVQGVGDVPAPHAGPSSPWSHFSNALARVTFHCAMACLPRLPLAISDRYWRSSSASFNTYLAAM